MLWVPMGFGMKTWEENIMTRSKTMSFRFVGHALSGIMLALTLPLGVANAQEHGGIIKVASDTPPVGLDPHIAIAYASLAAYEHVYETLLRYDAEMNLQPALAVSVEQPDDLTYVFNLRKGVTFHNGDVMNADAVKFSFDRILDPKTESPRASMFELIKSVTALDDYTVEIKMKEPFPAFLSQIATPNYAAIVSPKAVKENTDLQTTAIGTGPFRLTKYETGARILYERYEDYWDDGKPYVDGLEYTFTRDETTRIAALRRESVDIGWVREPRLASLLEDEPHLNIQQAAPIRHQRLFMRTDQPPLDNVKVRQALSVATDREEVIKTILLGYGTRSASVPPGVPPYAVPADEVADLPYQQYDPELAKQLLADAGYPDGLEFTLLSSPHGFDYIATAEVLQNQWSRVGIEVDIESVDWSTAIGRWRGGEFTAFLIANAWAPDPSNYVMDLFHSESDANYYGHNDPKLDEMLEEQANVSDVEKRTQLWREIQAYVAETAPALYLYGMTPRYEAVHTSVHGYKFMPNASRSYLREAWLEE